MQPSQKAKSPDEPTEAVAPTKNPPIHLRADLTLIHSPDEQEKEHKKCLTDGLRGSIWSKGKQAFHDQIKASFKSLDRYLSGL